MSDRPGRGGAGVKEYTRLLSQLFPWVVVLSYDEAREAIAVLGTFEVQVPLRVADVDTDLRLATSFAVTAWPPFPLPPAGAPAGAVALWMSEASYHRLRLATAFRTDTQAGE